MALTDDVTVAVDVFIVPSCADTDVVPAVADILFIVPSCAVTIVPVDTVGVVDGGGDVVGGADVWAGVGEYCNVCVGIIIDGNVGLGNILLICCGLI